MIIAVPMVCKSLGTKPDMAHFHAHISAGSGADTILLSSSSIGSQSSSGSQSGDVDCNSCGQLCFESCSAGEFFVPWIGCQPCPPGF